MNIDDIERWLRKRKGFIPNGTEAVWTEPTRRHELAVEAMARATTGVTWREISRVVFFKVLGTQDRKELVRRLKELETMSIIWRQSLERDIAKVTEEDAKVRDAALRFDGQASGGVVMGRNGEKTAIYEPR